MSLLFRLVFQEIVHPFLLSLAALCGLLLLGRLLPVLEPLFSAGVTLFELGKLIILLLPTLILFALSMATLLGVMLAFLRLSKDSEMIALFSTGVDPIKLLRPVVVFSAVAWLAAVVITVYIQPHAKFASKKFLLDITEKSLSRGLPQAVFFSPIKGLTIYVHESDEDGKRFKGVYIRDARRVQVASQILAEKGRLLAGTSGSEVVLRLENGTLNRIGGDFKKTDTLDFGSYTIKLKLSGEELEPGRGEMGLKGLSAVVNDPGTSRKKRLRYSTEFHKRLALPVGTFILGILAAPLGIFLGRTGPSGGIALGLAAFLSYYMLVAFLSNLAEAGTLPPALALWLPNVIFAVLAGFMIHILKQRGPLRG